MLPGPGSLVGGKYRIVRLLGEGGMGSVFEARHEHLGSPVALKFLHPDLAQRGPLVARFLQEAHVSAAIRNPHVTKVIDVDQTPEGNAYFVMELLDGESLEKRLEKQPKLPPFEAVDIGLQILAALEAAHAKNIVHRDLKPDNVWLEPSATGPYVKLLDFGIAKLKDSAEFRSVSTRPGSMMGTPAYMAPEQAISADQVDARADLYSFGVMMFEMLSGVRPVEGEDPREILERLVRGEVRALAAVAPGLPPGLTALVDRLVTPDPDRRPASAAAVRSELVQYARSSSQPPPGERTSVIEGGTRASLTVATTVPPEDALPPYVTRSQQAAALPKGGTQAIPAARGSTAAMAQLPYAPTVDARPSPARRGRGGLFAFAVLFLLAAGGAGAWLFFNQTVLYDTTLPPLPGPLPSAVTLPERLDAGVGYSGPSSRRPAGTARTGGSAAQPSQTGPQSPTLPFPIPTGLLQIPSSLPQLFPQIPGLTPPPGTPEVAPPSQTEKAPGQAAPGAPASPNTPSESKAPNDQTGRAGGPL